MICNSGLFDQVEGGSPRMGGMPSVAKSKLKEIHCPIIYILGGETDIAYNNGMDDFKRIDHVPAIAVNLPVGHGGTYKEAPLFHYGCPLCLKTYNMHRVARLQDCHSQARRRN